MPINKLPITLLIMTQNEEENIRHCINSVTNDFDQIIVTDSFSTDQTTSIFQEYDSLDLYQHDFLSWADQRNWMLDNCFIRNDIVFFLDADEYVTLPFIEELREILKSMKDFDSIYLSVKYMFLGSSLKYAYGHPKIKRIFRKSNLSFTAEGAREYANKEGKVLLLKAPLIHCDRKPISYWIDKHNKNAEREALFFLDKDVDSSYTHTLPWRLKVKIWIRSAIWNRLPLMVRPGLYFLYRYIFQLGILDKRAGLIYCYLHAFWYQSLIDIKIIEKRTQEK